MEPLAVLAGEHELVLTHGEGRDVANTLELGLRNELPDRDLMTVLTEVVVSADEPSPEPHAIAALRGLRLLIDAGVLVICESGMHLSVAVDGTGAMRAVADPADEDLVAALLARRLDADLLLMLTDADDPGGTSGPDGASRSISPLELRKRSLAADAMGPRVEAACRFVEATGRRAAIGPLADAVAVAHGEAGTQVMTRDVSQAASDLA